jgi:hypothetical protein
MKLEEEILDRASASFAEHIDKEIIDTIMIDVLVDEGWTHTKINPAFGAGSALTDWYIHTAEWIHINAKGDYKLLKGQWLFKDPKDATMFILRWS